MKRTGYRVHISAWPSFDAVRGAVKNTGRTCKGGLLSKEQQRYKRDLRRLGLVCRKEKKKKEKKKKKRFERLT